MLEFRLKCSVQEVQNDRFGQCARTGAASRTGRGQSVDMPVKSGCAGAREAGVRIRG
jgi:hypothetical protein